jgi:hypothetical protein
LKEAEGLARESVTIAEATDFLQLRARAFMSLGEVLRVAGEDEDAEASIEDAVRLFALKGYSAGVERARQVLEPPEDL